MSFPACSLPMSLRPYQAEAVAAVEEAHARGVLRQALQIPTGGGKTIIFAEVVRRRGGRALILAHRDELISQAADKLRMVAPDLGVGIVKAERNETGYPVTIASVQTVARPARLGRLGQGFTTVVVDEAHHAASDSYQRVLGETVSRSSLLLGVSATLERSDHARLDSTFDEVVYELSLLDLVRQGYLSDVRAVQVLLQVDFGGLHKRHGDYQDSELEQALREADAPEHAVAAYGHHAAGRKALLFAPTVVAAQEFAQEFSLSGYRAQAIWGAQPLEERRAALRAFSAGSLDILCNCMVLTEGFDEPSVDCVIMARPTCSRSLYVQMLGRGMRIAPGKDNLLVLDLVGDAGKYDLMTAASLLGVDPKRLEDDGLEEAERFEAGLKTEKQQAVQLAGELVAREVDLFRRRDVRWTVGEGLYTLSAGSEGVLVLRQVLSEAGASWVVTRRFRQTTSDFPRLYEEELASGLDLGYAQGIAEDYIRRAGAGAFSKQGAAWRELPPTENQAALLRRRGRLVPATRGEASDAISLLQATGKAQVWRGGAL